MLVGGTVNQNISREAKVKQLDEAVIDSSGRCSELNEGSVRNGELKMEAANILLAKLRRHTSCTG
jgi:hypothetical protein